MIFTMQVTIARQARRIRSVIFAIGAARCCLDAQTAAPIKLHFDVASVRPNHTAGCRGRWDFRASHGTVTAENAPLLRIISRAYNLTDDRVSGPAWIDSECYDIKAKVEGDVPERDLMPMLKGLLAERFHLVARRASGERPIFALVIDKGGSKMHPYGDRVSAPSLTNNGRILFMARHMPDLCERLGKVTGRPVIDKTGLNGDYMIVLTYLPFGSTSGDSSGGAPELGLRLESQRGSVEVLKIDSLDKVPTEN